jgi:hypothetical protein
MSQTGCWATNEVTECCWFSGGYGSTYDLSLYWVSLEGLKALVSLDWRNPYNDKEGFIKAGTCSRLRMKCSAYHISIPGDNGEKAAQWFEEVFPLAGKYQDEYMSYRKENGMSPYYNDDGYDGFFKTKPEFVCRQNCERMSDIVGTGGFNLSWDLGRNHRYFNGFFIVDDVEYNLRREEKNKRMEDMMKDFCLPVEEVPEKKELEDWQVPSDRPTYHDMAADDRYISKRWGPNGESYIHIPKDFFAFGAMINDDGYHFTEEICPPLEWFSFGGERSPKYFSHKYNIPAMSKMPSRRNYEVMTADYYIFGGHLPQLECYRNNCSFQAYDDMWNNEYLP